MISGTLPDVKIVAMRDGGGRVLRAQVLLDDAPSDPRGTQLLVNAFDLTALIAELERVRKNLLASGIKVDWSPDADGQGNPGAV